MVLDFLARFVHEVEVNLMTEAQAYVALRYFLTGFAKEQYSAVSNATSSRDGGVSCWPEAV